MDTVHECDRQTDRQTDRRTDRITITKTVQRIASHGKNVERHFKNEQSATFCDFTIPPLRFRIILRRAVSLQTKLPSLRIYFPNQSNTTMHVDATDGDAKATQRNGVDYSDYN